MHKGGELHAAMFPPEGSWGVSPPGFPESVLLGDWLLTQPRQPTIGRLLAYLGRGSWEQQYLAMYLLRRLGVECNGDYSEQGEVLDEAPYFRQPSGFRWTVTIDDEPPFTITPAIEEPL